MTAVPLPSRSVALRPLALPAEHGGWGLLFEPIVLGLLAVASWSGVLVAIAAVFAFLARHPLKLALQDAMRGRRVPRTPYCQALAAAYLLGGAVSLSAAAAIGGTRMLAPFVLAAPLAIAQLVYDGNGRGRALAAEIGGAVAMSSVCASIVLAGGMLVTVAYGLAGIVIARSVPAILYVRALLGRLPRSWALAVHAAAVLAVAVYASRLAVVAMIVLLLRAVWAFAHEPPRARTIGWREIVFGAITVGLVAASL